MIALDEARARLLALAPELQIETVDLVAAAGRILMADVHARRTQPVRDLSAMDGYAVAGQGPWTVIGESAAGRAFGGAVQPGEAVRIFTGAVVPEGAVAVLMQEDMAREGDQVTLIADLEIKPGKHIRPRGSDFSEGQLLIPYGTRLTAPFLALAAASGHGQLAVARPITVALVSTGDELVAPGQPCADDQIPSSNAIMLHTLLARPGLIMHDLGIVPDRRDALAAAIARASTADVIITIGGASVGDHDLVRPCLMDAGADLDFWKVAIKPGKPLMAGRLGASVVIGLPGNPVSAYVTALLFAVPMLNAMTGMENPVPPLKSIPCGVALPANGNRTDHVRARLVDGHVIPVGVNDSAALVALCSADGLIIRQPHAPAQDAGSNVDFMILS